MAKIPPFVPSGLTLTNSTISGPVSTTPDKIANLQLWLDASQPMYTAGYAAKVVNSGDQIALWPDRSGNGRTAVGSATKPTFNPTGFNGLPTIEFNGNSNFLTNSFLGVGYSAGFTLFVVSAAGVDAVNKVVIGTASNGMYLQRNDSAKSTSFAIAGLSPSPTVNPYTNGAGIDGLVYRGTSTTYCFDDFFCLSSNVAGSTSGSSNTVPTTGAPSLTGEVTIGNLAGGGFAWPGQVSEVLLFNRALTNEEYRMVYDYLSVKWRLSGKKFVLCAGNSLTSGVGSTSGPTAKISTTNTSYPGQLWNLLGATTHRVRAEAYPGRNTAQMLAETPSFGDMHWLPASTTKSICVVWEITNTLAMYASASAAYDQIVNYCKARKSRGYKVIVLTCLNRVGAYAGFAADAAIVNNLIRANYLQFADAIADVAADARLQTTTSATYFSADQIHLTDAGYAVVAGIVAPVVNSM